MAQQLSVQSAWGKFKFFPITLYIVNPPIEVKEYLTNKEYLKFLFEEDMQKPKGNWFTRMFKN